MGRWLSPDWSAAPKAVPYADFSDPQTLNLYAYVRNNPLSRADLDGHGDEELKKRAAQGAAASVGTQATNDAAVRAQYQQSVSQLQQSDAAASAARTAIKVEARAATSPGGQIVAETMRPIAEEAARAGGTVAKTSEGVNTAMGVAGKAGPVLMATGVAASAYSIATAENKPRAIAQEGGAWAGALSMGGLGAAAGAKAGAFVGAWFGGAGAVPGAAAGAVIGAIGGGAVGAITGSKAGTNLFDLFDD